MPLSEHFERQVALLVRSLPYVADEDCFALKGGTAINLFIRDLPRLSVDIDLTYLPTATRDEALIDIERALHRIAERLSTIDTRLTITSSAPRTQSTINKLVVRTPDRVQIKLEVTPVLRGCVFDPQLMTLSERAEARFGFAEMNVLAFPDLYAGKLVAALDRQHPRDLFDVHWLLEKEGISDDLRTAFIIYLISHDHAPYTLLSPPPKDIAHEFHHTFAGMTEALVDLDTLLHTRQRLADTLLHEMPDQHKRFLLSFYQRAPDWALLGIEGAAELPAIQWRELNLDKAGEETQQAIVRRLTELFGA